MVLIHYLKFIIYLINYYKYDNYINYMLKILVNNLDDELSNKVVGKQMLYCMANQ